MFKNSGDNRCKNVRERGLDLPASHMSPLLLQIGIVKLVQLQFSCIVSEFSVH